MKLLCEMMEFFLTRKHNINEVFELHEEYSLINGSTFCQPTLFDIKRMHFREYLES